MDDRELDHRLKLIENGQYKIIELILDMSKMNVKRNKKADSSDDDKQKEKKQAKRKINNTKGEMSGLKIGRKDDE